MHEPALRVRDGHWRDLFVEEVVLQLEEQAQAHKAQAESHDNDESLLGDHQTPPPQTWL